MNHIVLLTIFLAYRSAYADTNINIVPGAVPAGGTTAQVLSKNSNLSYDMVWTTASGGVAWGGITGTLSNQTDLQSALNAKQSSLTFTTPLINTAGTVAINGSVADNKLSFFNSSDAAKTALFDLSGQTTSTAMTIAPQNTSSMVLHIPQVATASGAGMALVQDETTGFIFSSGITSSLGGANSMMQLANASTANRAQIKLHSYFNGTSVSGVSTLTSRSGTIGTNAAVVAGQDYSKWTAQAGATTAGSAPISGAWAFKANTINSLTVTTDFHLQMTNLAGTLADALYLTSEGHMLLGTSTDTTNSRLVLKDGHLVSLQTTAPTASVNANAGTGATCTVSNATDLAGTINLTSTAVAPGSGAQCAVNFNKTYNVVPICIFSPASTNAATLAVSSGVYSTTSTSALTVNFATTDAVGHAYVWSYHCVETQ